jgi:pyruvate dehydrogenase complex dehydrogenase (E1) component
VIENEAPERAHYLMERMVDLARRRGAHIPSLPAIPATSIRYRLTRANIAR